MPTPPRSCDRLDDDHVTAEDGWLKRKVREAIEIKIGQPAMNRDQGYEPHPIYDELLLSRDRRQDGHMTSEG